MKTIVMPMVILAGLLSAPSVIAEQKTQEAQITAINGKVDIKFARDNKWTDAKKSMVLTEGDIVRTKNNSSVSIAIKDGPDPSLIDVMENSQLMFLEFLQDKKLGTRNTTLDLSAGEIAIKAKNTDETKNKFEVKTPTSMVGVQKGNAYFTIKVERED
jgi:hypothetical protein